MKNYYIAKNETSVGPFSLDQLKNQGILPNTKVWCEGMPDWVEARMLPELIPLFPVVMAVPPPIRNRENERLAKSTGIWRIVAVGTFVIMILVALWRFGNLQPSVDNDQSIVIDPVDLPTPSINPTVAVDDVPKPNNNEDEVIGGEVDYPEQLGRKDYLMKYWRELINVKVAYADYKNFGGMSDVFVEATNSMEYDVESVVFQVQYVLENGNIWKRRIFEINKVPANGTSERLQIEGSHRGKSIKFNIISAKCKEIGLNGLPSPN